MGKKEGNRPVKLSTWRLTSRDKARLEAAAALYGGTVQPWAEREGEHELVVATDELSIFLLPGQTLSQWHELWSGGGCQRRCDGEREVLSDGACLCDVEGGERKCKPTTRLSVMLPDVPGLGCWRLESHGYYAAVELAATSHMLEQATARGQLLPARLRIDQRRQVKDGKTTKYAVPVIDIDITMREALPLVGAGDRPAELPYTPIRKEIGTGVTVEQGLAGASASAEPRATNGRSAAPIPAGEDVEFGEGAVPVPDEQPPPAAAGAPMISKPQAKKLNVLVGTLRDAGHLTAEQIWASVGREPEPGDDGVLHWSPLRDGLTKQEASDLIERLERYEANLTAPAAGPSSEELVARLLEYADGAGTRETVEPAIEAKRGSVTPAQFHSWLVKQAARVPVAA